MTVYRKRKQNNRGFSLVEVLVAVAILAIVSLPIMKAFSSSASVNRNARRQENANTAATAIIEQFKAMSVDRLVEKYTDEDGFTSYTYDEDTGKYTFYVTNKDNDYYEGVNGEEFYIEVELDPTLYEDASDGTSDANNKANNINSYDMPSFSDISSKENYVIRDVLYKWDNQAKGVFMAEITEKNNAGGTAEVFNPDKVTKSVEITNSISADKSSTSDAGVQRFIQTVSVVIKYEYTGLEAVEWTQTLERNDFNVNITKDDYDTEKYIVSNKSSGGNMKDIYVFYMAYDRESGTVANDKITIKCNYDTGIAGDGHNVEYENIDTYIVEQAKTNNANETIKLQRENVSLYINGDVRTSFDTEKKTTDLPGTNGPVSIYSNIQNWDAYNSGYKSSGGRNNGITVNSPDSGQKYLYTINIKVWLDKESMEEADEPLVDMTSTKEN